MTKGGHATDRVLGSQAKDENFDADQETSASHNVAITSTPEKQGQSDGGNIVDFDGVDDPSNPLLWPPRYKWSLVALISIMGCIV